MQLPIADRESPLRQRWATAGLFFLDGTGFGVWAAHIAAFKQRLNLHDSQITAVLFSVILGAFTVYALSRSLDRSHARQTRCDSFRGGLHIDSLVARACVASVFPLWTRFPLWSSERYIAVPGLMFAGFGTANIVPVLWSAAGRDSVIGPGPAISIVSTIGYLGFLAGPPLIGGAASFIGLRAGMGIIVIAGLMVAILSARYRVGEQSFGGAH